jgi:soluble lytic murein transglycosylase
MRRVVLTLAVLAAAGLGGYAWLQHAQPAWWLRLRYPLYYRDEIVGYGHDYRLSPPLIAAVVYEESRFKVNIRSSAGAIGLMQLLPSTARGIALRTGGSRFRQSDLFTADINLRYGCWYLAHLRARYAGRRNAADLALAAYNAGQANVDRWAAASRPGGAVRIRFAETRAYVADVDRLEQIYRRAYGPTLGSG